VAEDVSSARIGNIKLSAMMDDKMLTCHPTKTCYLVVGTTRYRENIRNEVKKNPLMFGNFMCKEKDNDVYLGDVISSQGLEHSVELTVKKRLGLIRGAMYETSAIMEDYRLQAVGGMSGAWTIWERAICPKLLNNCGTWIGISKETIKTLNKTQNQYLKMIYSCPSSTPVPALRAMAGMLDMEHRVYLEKVTLVSSILFKHEDQESYAREMLEEEMRQGWVGLSSEVMEICKKTGLPDATKEFVSRKEVLDAITMHNLVKVKEEMLEKAPKKLEEMAKMDCRKQQDYMSNVSLFDSRLEFRYQANMLDTRTTMGNKYKQKACPHCREGQEDGAEESPKHILEYCAAYSDLRVGLNPLQCQMDRAVFLRQAVTRRKHLERKLT
jgi:hypothetical protein